MVSTYSQLNTRMQVSVNIVASLYIYAGKFINILTLFAPNIGKKIVCNIFEKDYTYMQTVLELKCLSHFHDIIVIVH